MDNKLIQFFIHDMIETGEYTLEGIALYARIPFEVIYDAACGIQNQFSITFWVRLVDLYIKVKPAVIKVLINKLLEMKEKELVCISSLLKEL